MTKIHELSGKGLAGFAVCQDCGAYYAVAPNQVRDADIANSDGNHLCPKCGGDLCGCRACVESIPVDSDYTDIRP